jgi:hypothetical protein
MQAEKPAKQLDYYGAAITAYQQLFRLDVGSKM